MPDAKPEWWDMIETIGTQIERYGIFGWFRRNIVRFLVGAIVGFVVDVAGIVRDAWDALNAALGEAGQTAFGAVGMVGEKFLGVLLDLNQQLFDLALGDALGPFEAPILAGLFLVEFAILFRLAKPALLALGEAASAVPVVGGLVNSGVTGGVRAGDALWNYGRSIIGGLT